MSTILSKESLPKYLVLASGLLLILFLSYWNFNNYKVQEHDLVQQIKDQLQLANSEIKDSLIISSLTILADDLGNKSELHIDTLEHTETMVQMIGIGKEHDHYQDKTDSFELKVFTDQVFDPLLSSEIDNKGFLFIDSTMIGSKKIERKFKFSTQEETEGMLVKILGLDYENNKHVYDLLKTRLIEKELPSDFSIAEKEDQVDGLRIVYQAKNLAHKVFTIDLHSYRSYLIGKILSSLLFSIFLLGLVGMAFWVLLSNWAHQQKLIKIKNEFISNMTHELKTPISTVNVALEAISNFDIKVDAEKTMEYIDISRHEISRLSLLVDKVLKMASFDDKMVRLNKEVIDLNELIKYILSSMKLHFEQKSVLVNFNSSIEQANILGDKIHCSNVVYNLIDNAIKYSNDDAKIDIDINDNEAFLDLKIKDNGMGISSLYLDKIFDRFFRVPTDDRHDVKGHGLGLSYVKEVVENHGGQISVTSNLGEGTCFIITLPKYKMS